MIGFFLNFILIIVPFIYLFITVAMQCQPFNDTILFDISCNKVRLMPVKIEVSFLCVHCFVLLSPHHILPV